MIKPFFSALVLAAMMALTVSAPVLAGHVHVRELGNGQCVILAASGFESGVTLPDAVFDRNPNVAPGPYSSEKRHPLHVLVHLAGAGNGMVHVYRSPGDTCPGYVND